MNRPLLFTFIVAPSDASLPAIATSLSLWRDDISQPVFADKRDRVGNIVVRENATATKDNHPRTSKESPMDASSSFLQSPAAGGLLTKDGQLTARPATRGTSLKP